MVIIENKRISFLISLLVFLLLFGTIGYKLLLEVSFLDAIYMTVITISTVGYAEVAQMDNVAKLFSIFLIFISIGTVGYLFSSIMSSFLEGDLKVIWRKKRMEKDILKLTNHYVVCGAGETGINAIKQFKKSMVDFVVIEKDKDKVDELIAKGVLVVHGDSTSDTILKKARVAQAKGLISALPTDAENVYTVLTARSKNNDLYIVSRAIEANSDEKLKRAGANNTISPNEIGGSRMAALMLRPTVISFLDIMTHAGDIILDLENVIVEKNSPIKNLSLKEAKIPEKTGLIVLAIRKKENDQWIFNPSGNENLRLGDAMVVLGTQDQVKKLRLLSNYNN